MLTYIFATLNEWLENGERRRREAYLASSSNLAELEHRIRELEESGFRPL